MAHFGKKYLMMQSHTSKQNSNVGTDGKTSFQKYICTKLCKQRVYPFSNYWGTKTWVLDFSDLPKNVQPVISVRYTGNFQQIYKI
ncbi:MAG: hypothetical protein MAG458_00245 [Nitrosopumilus sp.]|nr:hypothetical protein [Nitrosopumilus sp.]